MNLSTFRESDYNLDVQPSKNFRIKKPVARLLEQGKKKTISSKNLFSIIFEMRITMLMANFMTIRLISRKRNSSLLLKVPNPAVILLD
jgi:hypothetical protein